MVVAGAAARARYYRVGHARHAKVPKAARRVLGWFSSCCGVLWYFFFGQRCARYQHQPTDTKTSTRSPSPDQTPTVCCYLSPFYCRQAAHLQSHIRLSRSSTQHIEDNYTCAARV